MSGASTTASPRRPRRSRHGRPLRSAVWALPAPALGSDRVTTAAADALDRLIEITPADAAHVGELEALEVAVEYAPAPDVVWPATTDDVIAGGLLATTRRMPTGTLRITLHSQPLLMWADADADEVGAAADVLTALVRQVVAEQAASGLGLSVADIDPAADPSTD
jgi:hypothetical protein